MRTGWFTPERITAGAAIFGAAAAIAAVVVAFLALSVADDALSTTEEQLFRANRAWVAPMRATLDWDRGDLAVGQPLHLIVHHRNTGHGPATGFVAQHKIKSFPHPGQQTWYSTFTPDRIEGVCGDTKAAEDGLVVYPSDTAINQYRLTTHELPITEEIVKGEQMLYVEGCFAYFTFDEEHKSAYCFMLIPKKGSPPKSWSFAFCPRGNTAD